MEMRKCVKCGKTLSIDNFVSDSSRKDGKFPYCRDCKKAYRNSIQGVITKMYSHQKSSSKKRGHKPPTYTKKEFTK